MTNVVLSGVREFCFLRVYLEWNGVRIWCIVYPFICMTDGGTKLRSMALQGDIDTRLAWKGGKDATLTPWYALMSLVEKESLPVVHEEIEIQKKEIYNVED